MHPVLHAPAVSQSLRVRVCHPPAVSDLSVPSFRKPCAPPLQPGPDITQRSSYRAAYIPFSGAALEGFIRFSDFGSPFPPLFPIPSAQSRTYLLGLHSSLGPPPGKVPWREGCLRWFPLRTEPGTGSSPGSDSWKLECGNEE